MDARPQTMQEALPPLERVREARAKLSEAGVRYILSCWIDLFGVPKTKPVPLSELENLCMGKGPAVRRALDFLRAGNSRQPTPDQIPIPDLDSLVICPWDRACAWMFADLWWEDAPYNLCPRSRPGSAWPEMPPRRGTRGFAGIEPEFIAMRWRDGQPVKAFDDDPPPGEGVRPRRQAFGYDTEYSIDFHGIPLACSSTRSMNSAGGSRMSLPRAPIPSSNSISATPMSCGWRTGWCSCAWC